MYELNEIISEKISECNPRNWDEDYITRQWINEFLRYLKNTAAQAKSIGISCDAYKLGKKLKLEEKHGDIAVLVKIIFNNGKELVGVGFLEAKKLYANDGGKNKYDAMKKEQLYRLNEKSKYHHVLLYNYKKQLLINTISYNCYHPNFLHETCAIVIPTAHVIAYEDESEKLSSIGYSLVEQIFLRYFKGQDLNFDDEIVQSVISGAKGGISYVITAHVTVPTNYENEIKLEPIALDTKNGFEKIIID